MSIATHTPPSPGSYQALCRDIVESVTDDEAEENLHVQPARPASPEQRDPSPDNPEQGNRSPSQPPDEALSVDVVLSIGGFAVDERDEQSASERYETDRENSVHADAPPKTIRKPDGVLEVESDTKRRLSPTLHVDSSTVAISPVFQTLPAYFPSEFFATRSHPWNRSGFRYLACGPPPNQQQCQHETPVYYIIESPPAGVVKWSWEDRSSYVHITKDGLSVTTDRGFRSARANLPIREGQWYFEIVLGRAGGEVNQGARSDPEEAHVRVGVARRESGLNGPVGIDGHSYGIRDKTGEKVHLSRLQPYGEPFGTGDVVGVLIDLPKMRQPVQGDDEDPGRIERKRVPIRFRRQLYFESPEYPVSKEMEELAELALPSKLKPKQELHSATAAVPATQKKTLPGQKQPESQPVVTPTPPIAPPLRNLPVLKGSRLIFFKNGVSQGVAFRDLLDFLPLRSDPNCTQRTPVEQRSAEDATPEPTTNQSIGVALHDDGTLGYYPCVSVYGGGIARLNAGPEFKFRPPPSIDTLLDPPSGSDIDQSSGEGSQTGQSWRPLSELYPIHMAEQRRLDELEGIKIRRELAQATQLAEQAIKTKNTMKRKRVSSPSSAAAGTAPGKGKKKGKLVLPGEGLHAQSFKPSPLGNMEVFGEQAAVDQPSPGEQAVVDGTSSLSILCQVASESIAVQAMERPPEEETDSNGIMTAHASQEDHLLIPNAIATQRSGDGQTQEDKPDAQVPSNEIDVKLDSDLPIT